LVEKLRAWLENRLVAVSEKSTIAEAQKVVKDEIKRLDAANDKSGVRMWSLVAEQLPRVRAEPILVRPRSLALVR
jgi:hypothetical protein